MTLLFVDSFLVLVLYLLELSARVVCHFLFLLLLLSRRIEYFKVGSISIR